LGRLKALELGCGSGGVLLEYLTYGVPLNTLHGCDLLPKRLTQAKSRLFHLNLSCADGQALPYPSNCFDLVMQYTVFSSILDDAIKVNLAKEMLRVVHPKGIILWYDFWLNPTNAQTKGIRPKEIRELFPNCAFRIIKTTLAPPLAKRLVPISWILALLLEKLRFFNSHYLATIKIKEHE